MKEGNLTKEELRKSLLLDSIKQGKDVSVDSAEFAAWLAFELKELNQKIEARVGKVSIIVAADVQTKPSAVILRVGNIVATSELKGRRAALDMIGRVAK